MNITEKISMYLGINEGEDRLLPNIKILNDSQKHFQAMEDVVIKHGYKKTDGNWGRSKQEYSNGDHTVVLSKRRGKEGNAWDYHPPKMDTSKKWSGSNYGCDHESLNKHLDFVHR